MSDKLYLCPLQALLDSHFCTQWVNNVSEKEFHTLVASLDSRYSFEGEKDTISVHLMDLGQHEKSMMHLLPTTRDTDRQAAWSELRKPLERVLRCSDCYKVLEIPRSSAASVTSTQVSKFVKGRTTVWTLEQQRIYLPSS